MITRISYLCKESEIKDVRNVDMVIIPCTSKLNIRKTKMGKELGTKKLLFDIKNKRRSYIATTGETAYPYNTSLVMDSDNESIGIYALLVEPDLKRCMSDEQKYDELYLSYKQCLSIAMVNNCKTVILPLLGVSKRFVDKSIVARSLMTALSDSTKDTIFFKEICILPRGKCTGSKLGNIFKTYGTIFGLSSCVKRESYDFNELKYSIVY